MNNNLAKKLLDIDEQRIQRERVVLNTVWDRLVRRIELNMQHKNHNCMFEIPTFIMGCPPINVERTMRYLLDKIQKEGLYALQVTNTKIFVLWSLDALRKSDTAEIAEDNQKMARFREDIRKEEDLFFQELHKEKMRERRS